MYYPGIHLDVQIEENHGKPVTIASRMVQITNEYLLNKSLEDYHHPTCLV
jgi:hypothetical protein